MNVSVLIPVSSDLRISDCVRSIDENIELVISLNRPTKELKSLVKKMAENPEKFCAKKLKVKICVISYLSIAGAYNNGIRHSSNDLILLMDSDCVFSPGCIRKLYHRLDTNKLSKGKVNFLFTNRLNQLLARAREFHTSDFINAYSPPLLFNKDIIDDIKGYYFHPRLCWMEDGEFDCRVKEAKLKISYDPTAIVEHCPLILSKDLINALWYGVGRRISFDLGLVEKPSGFIQSINNYFVKGWKAKGFLVGAYLLFWKYIQLIGYYSQGVLKIRK